MAAGTQAIDTFPSVALPSHCGGLPVEVALIAQLGIGAGDALIDGVRMRQAAHASFVDALDEPSARLGAMDLARGDASTLYSFAVGRSGHPFHRHAGNRVFTAVSGSSGAMLRFSTVDDAELARDADAFVRALRQVRIPPDCLFTVRFGGGTWHQFLPLDTRRTSPALFALSCHPDERGGVLSPALRDRVAANDADIPSLTEVLPEAVGQRLRAHAVDALPTVSLSLHVAPRSWAARLCMQVRRRLGPLRRRLARLRHAGGYAETARPVATLADFSSSTMLDALPTERLDHEDAVSTRLSTVEVGGRDAPALLADLLHAFVAHPPAGVGRLMRLRNRLVAPLRLRTSPLGCPVSSLLANAAPDRFAGFPVLAHEADARSARVLLGADDRHLRFRTQVDVVLDARGDAVLTMATRVQCLNTFGQMYLAAIERTHRRYVAPTMLRAAADAVAKHRP